MIHFESLPPFLTCMFIFLLQGASRTSEDGERERREADERIGGGPRAPRALPPGGNPPGGVDRIRNGPNAAASNPASRGVPQSGES